MSRPLVVLLGSLFAGAAAAAPPTSAELDRIDVRATRTRAVQPFELPLSLGVLGLDDLRQRPGHGVSEALAGVPGVLARERQNWAQDTQLSLRGFGARATFGVRGVRLYADGIPATLPDGQGQLAHFAPEAGERIEVLRGPFSVLHGNASGGVLQLWSDPGGAPSASVARAVAGSDGLRTLALRRRGGDARLGYHVAAARLQTDGTRAHAAARRSRVHAVTRLALGARGRLDLVLNHFDQPYAQDPLGLTRAQRLADPQQVAAPALAFDTRKTVRQDQGGARLEHELGAAQTLQLAAWRGRREVTQFLAIPVVAQAAPAHAGGVVDLAGDYDGADARWQWQGALGRGEAELALGFDAERQRQQRRGYENFVGAQLGVRGTLRRDERNDVTQRGPYAQLWWRFAPRWGLLAGVRRSRVAFRARDFYVRPGNPNDSGAVDYAQTTPVAGLSFAAQEDLRLYASLGRGFETPTFNELGYRADGGAGLAFDLRPSRTRHYELGAKWRGADGATLEAALFRADGDDELAVARNIGGRSSFRNVGRTRRQGIELAWQAPLADAWDLALAYTRLDARFRDAFALCSGAPCSTPTAQVAAGTRLPGLARDQAFARLDWRRGGWETALETQALGPVSVNDTGSERAPGHVLLHLETAREWRGGGGAWRAFARLDNLLDRDYVGSVIVNEGNARYYEPGPGRSVLFGLEWRREDE